MPPLRETQETQRLEPVSVDAEPGVPALISSGLDGAAHTQPLSVVSYSAEQLMALGARDLQQAVETVSSASAPVDYQLQPQGSYRMRGFNAYVLRDGFQSFGSYGERDSLAGIDRIDFIKGPGSALNSGALGLPPGGVINIHSAWPGEKREISLAAGVASYDRREWQVEIDSGDLLPVISAGLAYGRGEGGGFFDWARLDYEKLRPSVSLRFGGGRLSLYHEDSSRLQRDHPGLPTTGTLDRSDFTIPDSRSVSDPDLPDSHTAVRSTGFDGEWPLSEVLTLSLAGRRAESEIYQAAQYVSSNSPDVAPGLLPSTFQHMSGTYTGQTLEEQGVARLDARLAHDRLGRFKGWLSYGGEQGPDHVDLRIGVATPLDLAQPRYGRWLGAPIPFQQADSEFRIRNRSLGLQWRYSDWLNAFAAQTRTRAQVRTDQTTITQQLLEDLAGEPGADALQPLIERLSNALLPDAGLFVHRLDDYDLTARQYGISLRAWDAASSIPDDGLWVFYGRGNGHQFRAYFASQDTPRPELSNQREAGLRLVNQDWGRIEAARFTIERRNVATLDPNSLTGFGQVTTGLQSVRGYDVEASLNPPYSFWDRFTLNASAAWLDARLDEDNTFAVGNALADVPRRRWRVQLFAELLRREPKLAMFATRRCQGDVQGDLRNSFTVPGYCLWDGGVTATWRGFSIDAVVSNIADTDYYRPYTYLFSA